MSDRPLPAQLHAAVEETLRRVADPKERDGLRKMWVQDTLRFDFFALDKSRIRLERWLTSVAALPDPTDRMYALYGAAPHLSGASEDRKALFAVSLFDALQEVLRVGPFTQGLHQTVASCLPRLAALGDVAQVLAIDDAFEPTKFVRREWDWVAAERCRALCEAAAAFFQRRRDREGRVLLNRLRLRSPLQDLPEYLEHAAIYLCFGLSQNRRLDLIEPLLEEAEKVHGKPRNRERARVYRFADDREKTVAYTTRALQELLSQPPEEESLLRGRELGQHLGAVNAFDEALILSRRLPQKAITQEFLLGCLHVWRAPHRPDMPSPTIVRSVLNLWGAFFESLSGAQNAENDRAKKLGISDALQAAGFLRRVGYVREARELGEQCWRRRREATQNSERLEMARDLARAGASACASLALREANRLPGSASWTEALAACYLYGPRDEAIRRARASNVDRFGLLKELCFCKPLDSALREMGAEPKTPSEALWLASYLQWRGDGRQALRWLAPLLPALRVASPSLRVDLALFWIQAGRDREALSLLRNLQALRPEQLPVEPGRAGATPDDIAYETKQRHDSFYGRLAYGFALLGRWDEALSVARHLSDPGDVLRDLTHFLNGKTLLRKQQPPVGALDF